MLNSEWAFLKLVTTYRRFKQEPKRVFIVADFNIGCRKMIKQEFKCLISLGLIEPVKVIYKTGKNQNSRREIVGYRFLR